MQSPFLSQTVISGDECSAGGLPKGWMLVVLLNRGWNSGGKDSSSQRPRPAASSPWCPAWHDRAVVVPVVPVAADSVPPSAHVRLKGCRTF